MRRGKIVATQVASIALLTTLAPTSATAGRPVALVGGEVHTVTGGVLSGATVLVDARGRIGRVGTDLPLPDKALVIDCRGKIVTPGLIESLSRLGLVEISLEPSTVDASPSSPDPIRAAVDVSDAIDVRSSLVGVARRHGVTSAVALPGGGLVSGQGAWFDLLDGRTDAWRTAIVGPVAMRAVLGEAGAGAVGGSRATAMMRLMEALDDARAYRTSKAAYGRNAMRKLITSRLDLEALQGVNARRQSLLVGVNRASDILAVLRFAKKARIDVVLTGVAEGWLVADAIAAAGVPVVVNALANLPRRFESKNSRADNGVLMARAGVKVAIATGSAHNVSGLRFALGNAVRAGMPRDLALKAATLHPAEIFRLGRKYGAIQRGRVANLVVWSGDPFEPSSAAEHVIIRGEVQTTENRQTRLRDRYKARLGL